MWFINLTLYFLFIFFYTFWCRWMLKPLTGVLPICVLCLEMYRWTNKWDGHSWGDAPLPDHFLFSLGSLFIYLFILISFFRLIVYCFCLFCMCSFVKQNRDVLSRSSSVSSVHSLWVLLSLIILQYLPSPYSSLHSSCLSFPLPYSFLSVTVPIISIINCLLHCVPHSHNSICN